MTFEAGVCDFDKTNIPRANFFQKKIHATQPLLKKIDSCSVSCKKHVIQRKRYSAYTRPEKKRF